MPYDLIQQVLFSLAESADTWRRFAVIPLAGIALLSFVTWWSVIHQD